MADVPERKNRDQESRKSETRKSDSWLPEKTLPMPNPQAGWQFKYIRTASLGKADTRNVSTRFREGWVPVDAKEVPELQVMNDLDSRWPDGIEIGGLLLCKLPVERAEARNNHFAGQATKQLESVNSGYMNDQHPSMPKHNRSKSRTSFGKG